GGLVAVLVVAVSGDRSAGGFCPDDEPSLLADLSAFLFVGAAPDAVFMDGGDGVVEALDADRAALADGFGFSGAVPAGRWEDQVVVHAEAGCVVPPRGVVFGGEHVVVRERGRPAHDPTSTFGWGFSGGPRTSGPTRSRASW